jgi:hypothetical protein
MPIRLRPHRLALLLVLALCLPIAARAGQAPAAHPSQASAARADDASRRAKAAQLVTLLHSESMVQQAFSNIMQQVTTTAQNAAGPSPTPENKAKLDGFEKKVSQLLDAQLGWKAMEPTITGLYSKTFTEQELDGIVAFYKTPAGIALLDKMPGINTQVNQLAQSRLTSLQPQINQMFVDFLKSMPAPESAPAASPAPAATPAPTTSSPK